MFDPGRGQGHMGAGKKSEHGGRLSAMESAICQRLTTWRGAAPIAAARLRPWIWSLRRAGAWR